MFSGIMGIFKAVSRLTSSLNRAADLVDKANDQIETNLFGDQAQPKPVEALPAPVVEQTKKNGKVVVRN